MDKQERKTSIVRNTNETQIQLTMNLDGKGNYQINTGLGFFDHMLAQFSRFSGIDLEIEAKGDLEVDGHHLIEDVGIVLGQALRECLQEKRGITRYGEAYTPMDESLSLVVVDISGRPKLVFNGDLEPRSIQGFEAEMVPHFFESLCAHAFITLHIQLCYGTNLHHKIESIFKGVGRALGQAVTIKSGDGLIPSTKGCL